MGLYNYNSAIWDNLVLPEGINKDDVILNIMTECSDMHLLYPSWPWMQQLIGVWSRKNQITWTKLLETMTVEYSPIENYDRYENWTDTTDRTDKTDHSINTTSNSSSTQTGSRKNENEYTDHYTDNESEKAFNDTMYVGRGMNEHNGYGDSTTDVTDSMTGSGEGSTKETGTNTRNEDGTVTHSGHIHGNIGVTTAMKMIEEQRQIVMFNMIDTITKSFKMEFCVCIY